MKIKSYLLGIVFASLFGAGCDLAGNNLTFACFEALITLLCMLAYCAHVIADAIKESDSAKKEPAKKIIVG